MGRGEEDIDGGLFGDSVIFPRSLGWEQLINELDRGREKSRAQQRRKSVMTEENRLHLKDDTFFSGPLWTGE